ncbi:DUF262 domain-containing protein [Oculatella sp. FACHB-28]|uniref:DUF262 domain-containing protein n=1 Tax=Oculatella sp. FACHB-28 TaxID=2692845 RepID=UPI00168632FC|nr:DUF262 domain-containing protein [Oculatella sp. FACHB-28]MBD2059750.1 DUF262 domain-containing protein [Oculatella sp. FACHB-28]
MELHAYTRTISDLFSVKRKYVVPRFQRAYSWSKEQVKELWDDIVTNIQISNEKDIKHEEYFIEALVLVGDDKSNVLQIVDGQQRLTTITILLSVLCERFKELKKENLAEAIFKNYIEGQDDDGRNYFKLDNETPKPFFQKSIQYIDKEQSTPQSDEEKTLLSSYQDFYTFTVRDNLAGRFRINQRVSDEKYELLLRAIRDQVVKYLKVIFITVTEEEEAYTIFETLNARGMNLSFVDLIKNRIFKELSDTHPDDNAKTTWKNIRLVIASRDTVGSLETFVRHWWISKYSYVGEEKIYKNFKKLWMEDKIEAKEFIKELYSDAGTYIKIASPIQEDFKQQEERFIFDTLSSFKVFNITQQRPFLLSLFKAKERRIVKLDDQKEIMLFLERFHFMFNAVCSLRPSGIEGSYSRAARDLQNAIDRRKAREILNGLRDNFAARIPDEAVFMNKFKELKFYSGYTRDKKLIQYIFNKIERSKLVTNELAPENISLEHILCQANNDKEIVGKIGNLLPLSQELNEKAKDKSVIDKLSIYQKSQYSLPREFAAECAVPWNANAIDRRTESLAKYCYHNIWQV